VHGPDALPAVDPPWHRAELAALRDAIRRYDIPVAPFRELVAGVEMDLTRRRYPTFAHLDLYCFRVAGTVGLMLAPVLGYSRPRALRAAADLGRAMQLTNILRDVREDLGRGRVYLPQDELAAFGVSEDDLARGHMSGRMRRLFEWQIARARACTHAAAPASASSRAHARGSPCASWPRCTPTSCARSRRRTTTSSAAAPSSAAAAGSCSSRAASRGGEHSVRSRRVAVIGGGIGGLTAAGLLASGGIPVTLFEAGQRLGGKAATFEADGLRLDLGPTLLTMPSVVRDTFARIGATDLLPPIVPLALQCEYRFASGMRYRAWSELARSVEEASAFGVHEAGGLRRFYADANALWRVAGEPYLEAPFDGLGGFLARVGRRGLSAALRGLRMGTLAQLAARHFRSHEMRQFVGTLRDVRRRVAVRGERGVRRHRASRACRRRPSRRGRDRHARRRARAGARTPRRRRARRTAGLVDVARDRGGRRRRGVRGRRGERRPARVGRGRPTAPSRSRATCCSRASANG
jgi:hypothetical protein